MLSLLFLCLTLFIVHISYSVHVVLKINVLGDLTKPSFIRVLNLCS
jgi:hypothetical protein